jgi:hypothetical protein
LPEAELLTSFDSLSTGDLLLIINHGKEEEAPLSVVKGAVYWITIVGDERALSETKEEF